MAEYIEREALKDAFWSACKNCLSEDDIADLIDDAPAVDVAPVVHGRWEPKRKMYRTPNAKNYTCSECGFEIAVRWHYCPYCGAQMDGQQNEKEGN